MQFVVMTDTHFVAPGSKLYALDPSERLKVAVEAINRDHPQIAFVIVTGDLAHWGEEPAYRHLADVLTGLNAPTVLMMGNHDKRSPFRAAFPLADRDPAGFVQSVRRLEAATIVTLDTLDEAAPNHEGLLCRDRLTFLEEALAAAPTDKPLLLFQHHPPFDTGLKYMDRIKLRNGAEEWSVISRTRRPDYLFMGHLHRPIAGAWHGIPFHIQRALGHQVAFDLETSEHIPGSHEAPDYALVTLHDYHIVIHQCSFLYAGPRFSLHDANAQAAQSIGELMR
jgi:3',5'-cyclic AMP phosphodiesterase CpdA